MFRTIKFLYKIVAVLFGFFLIQYTGFDSGLAVLATILLVTGPDGLEAYMVREGYLQERGEGSATESE